MLPPRDIIGQDAFQPQTHSRSPCLYLTEVVDLADTGTGPPALLLPAVGCGRRDFGLSLPQLLVDSTDSVLAAASLLAWWLDTFGILEGLPALVAVTQSTIYVCKICVKLYVKHVFYRLGCNETNVCFKIF